MADQAVVGLPLKLRHIRRGLLIKRVEDGSQDRIGHGKLQHITALAKAKIHGVIEVERAGRFRRNAAELQTGA